MFNNKISGALKNPLAIGAGMIEGSHVGINTMAAYLTRSSLELQELCRAMGGEASTISGLAGVGDLILTAFGALSRNRSLGTRLIAGEKLEDIQKDMTIEGVPTAKVAVEFAKRCGLDMPIFSVVARILSGELSIEDAHIHLMGKPLSSQSSVNRLNNSTILRNINNSTDIDATEITNSKISSNICKILED